MEAEDGDESDLGNKVSLGRPGGGFFSCELCKVTGKRICFIPSCHRLVLNPFPHKPQEYP